MQIKAIHQFSPSCSPGDGVTNGMFFTRRLLRELGFVSEIYSDYIPPALIREVRPLREFKPGSNDLLFMHHCLGYDNCKWLEELTIPKVMVYHNITPSHLLPEEGGARRLSILGRQQLAQWSTHYIGAIGDSEYNSAELREACYQNVATIPMLVDVEKIRHAEWDRSVLAPFRDSLNLLFVGRVCENKHQIELIEMLDEFLHFTDQPVRLILAGGTTSELYRQRIEALIKTRHLEDHVVLAGKVSDAALLALYRTADAFVCMSEHEGFGMPLIEAMLFDVPVIAHAISSIPDTLGEGGLMLKDDNPREAAALLHLLLSEPAIRRRVIAAQRRNLQRFDPDHLQRQLSDYLVQIGVEVPRPPVQKFAAESQPYWQVEGPFDSSYSLAVVNREIGKALSKRGIDTGLRSMEGTGDYVPSPGFLKSNPDCAALARRAVEATVSPDVSLRFCYPPIVDDMRGNIRVVHSYGWEETGFPAEYVAAFNRKLDLITVLSSFVKKTLRDNGVRTPIAVTGGGVDHLLGVTAQSPNIEMRGFRFLHISSCFPRKGIDALLAAYGKAFRNKDDVSLVIKTFPNPHNDVALQLKLLREQDVDFPHVALIERDCNDAELVGLYAACDAFVAPSRGEGLGLPMAEAMLFNLPVITTAWGGQRDFCDVTTAWLCDYRFARAETHLGMTHSVWADPDIDHLARLLCEVRALSPKQRAIRTDIARERILRDFTWNRVAQRTEEAVHALPTRPEFRNEPMIGWISTWNTRCGIAAYSSFLTVALPADRVTILANRAVDCVADDEKNVVRCWNSSLTNLSEKMDDVYKEIIARGISAVVIQYNTGFYSLQALAGLIDRLDVAGVTVHCFFHATSDQMHGDKLITLSDITGSLVKCERIYVHGINDLNTLKEFGLVDNVTLFPQGVLPTPATDREAERQALGLVGKKVIAAYGFLLPHKGIQQLLAAFSQLAKEDASLHLLLVTALYPAPESTQEKTACQALISKLKLSGRVTMITDFLTDAQSLAKLRVASVVVYPYKRTKESSSAAVRMGLAAGCPVAVTPLPIFDDVADAVHALPGTDVDSIATGIRQLLDDPALAEEQVRKAEQWTASRQWPLLSVRLLNLIDGIANPLASDARHI